jgi:hypothetical protein
MRRDGLIGELVTSLHQPFLTLLRTKANKDRLGWGGAFAVRNGERETVSAAVRLGKCL